MRSQNEILEKITQITKILESKRSPIYFQYRVLIHKLTWENAKQFIVPKDQTAEYKLKWKNTCQMEKKFVLTEISEQVDIGAMCVQNKDKIGSLGCALVVLTQIWLLGENKNKELGLLWQEFYQQISPHIFYENVFSRVCEEFGIPWESYKIRYSMPAGPGLENK